jgi:type IV pilus assembly protein PilX
MKKARSPHASWTPVGASAPRGFALIASLAVLLMLTLLSLGMFRSFGLEERITGNTREKQHAFFAAQSALQSAEGWLLSNAIQGTSGNPGTACSTTTPSPNPQICNTAPAQQTLATTAWNCSFGTPYSLQNLPAVTINGSSIPQLTPQTGCSGGTLSTGTVYMDPQYTISYLGPDHANPGSFLYQVTSLGYGGNQNSVAVVQSVYSVGSAHACVTDGCGG